MYSENVLSYPLVKLHCEMAWQRKSYAGITVMLLDFTILPQLLLVYPYISKEIAQDLRQVWSGSAFKLALFVDCRSMILFSTMNHEMYGFHEICYISTY